MKPVFTPVLCVCFGVGHTGEPAKTIDLIGTPFAEVGRGQTCVGSDSHVDEIHVVTTYRTRLNDLCSAAMRLSLLLL